MLARGITLAIDGGDTTLKGLVEDVQPLGGEFDLSQETRTEANIYFVRTDLLATEDGQGVKVGSHFKNVAEGITYRVTTVLPRHSDFLSGFRCECSREDEP